VVAAALPLGFVTLLVSLQANVPRLFIEQALGLEHLGLFAAASQLTTAGGNVVGAVGMAVNGRLARAFAEGRTSEFARAIASYSIGGVACGAAGAVLSALIGGPLLAVVYRHEYASGGPLLVWLSIAAGAGYAGSFLGYGMTMAQRTVAQLPLFAGAVLVSAIASACLVPLYGVTGAAWATACGNVFQVVGSVYILHTALVARRRTIEAETAVASS
jgi:O-antigen/teichoic acid export membrane protein